MNLTVTQIDLLLDALAARSARYDAMTRTKKFISTRALHRYQMRRDRMRLLRHELLEIKRKNKPMSICVN